MLIDNIARDLWMYAEKGRGQGIVKFLGELSDSTFDTVITTFDETRGELPLHVAVRNGHGLGVLDHICTTRNGKDLIHVRTKGGYSALHLAALHGNIEAVEWLVSKHSPADCNLPDEVSYSTPLHLAVGHGHKQVAARLVEAGASLTLENDKNMMPLGLCKDPEMFRTLFSRIDDRRIEREMDESWANLHPCKTILHYAALHCTDEALIEKLYLAAASTRPRYRPDHQSSKELLEHVDEEGKPFLHNARKHMLKVIFKGLIRKERDFTKLLVMNCGLYDAFMGNRRLFDALASDGTTSHKDVWKFSLESIQRELRFKLRLRRQDVGEKERQELDQAWTDSLPTYLALYLGKHEVLNFLMDSSLEFTLNQWDAVEKRTCLHWAVVHNRVDIVDRLFICSLSCCKGKNQKQEMVECRMRFKKPSPSVVDGAGMTAFHIAFNQKNEVMMQTLRRQKEFNEYEDKLLKDRDVYVQSVNAILVGAALIAGITFAGWLQVPSHVFGNRAMITFWITNSLSFVFAVAAMGLSIGILLLTPTIYIGQVVFELQRGIMYIAFLLMFSLAGATVAFITAGFAAFGDQTPQPEYNIAMGTTTSLGGLVCVVILAYYTRQVKLHRSAYRQQRITSHSNEEHEPPEFPLMNQHNQVVH